MLACMYVCMSYVWMNIYMLHMSEAWMLHITHVNAPNVCVHMCIYVFMYVCFVCVYTYVCIWVRHECFISHLHISYRNMCLVYERDMNALCMSETWMHAFRHECFISHIGICVLCMHIFIYMNICIYVFTDVFMFISTCICIYVYTYVYMYVNMCICVYVSMYTCIRVYM